VSALLSANGEQAIVSESRIAPVIFLWYPSGQLRKEAAKESAP